LASKKKTTWKTAAGLVLATATWLSIAKDLPITTALPPAPPPPPVLPGRFTECPEGFYRKSIGGQWRCWPVYVAPPPPPDCGRFSTPKWDAAAKTWRCVPKGLL